MVIKSHASRDELSSPFYIANQDFCKEFERYTGSKSGLIKGKYNARAYNITAKISSKNEWVLNYNKATFTSTGNLFLSSKKQCLRVNCSWSSHNFQSESLDFKIRKRRLIDSLSTKWKILTPHFQYSIKTSQPNSDIILELNIILTYLFIDEKIFEIEYSNNTLKIEVQTEELHLDILDKLLNI